MIGARREAFRRVFAAAIFSVAAAATSACELTFPQLRTEALEILRGKFPADKFTLGKTVDVIRMGEVELGLQNLRSKFCTPPALNVAQRRDEMIEFFEKTIPLTKNYESKIPATWSEARKLVRLQMMHTDYLRPFAGKKVLVTRPFIPDVHLAVVVDQPKGYIYVREEDRVKWKVDEKALFETALKNVDLFQKTSGLKGGAKPDAFLVSEEKDGFDAARLLLPWVRAEAAKHLGNPFLAAVPNRDFLIMWGAENSAHFQDRARQNVAADYVAQPYKLSPQVLRVWADGRIEVAK